jgi:hypothetical protein
MDVFLKDLKHSARMFLQTPSFTIAAIAALALGILGKIRCQDVRPVRASPNSLPHDRHAIEELFEQ